VNVGLGILASIALPSFAAWISSPLDDPNSEEALNRAKTLGGPGSLLCGLRAYDGDAMAVATRSWLSKQSTGSERSDFIFSREWDAFGHCWQSCDTCRRCGQSGAWYLGHLWENLRDTGFSPWVGPPFIGPHDSSRQDRNNHEIGIYVAATTSGSCSDGCDSAKLDLTAPRGAYAWDINKQKRVPSSSVPPL
jgi:hypothetical protein